MKNTYPILTIAISLTLAISYFIYVASYLKNIKWDTATSFVTTVLSIVIGAMISILIYNAQKTEQDKQKLSELRQNLEAEISDMSRVLSSKDVITVNGMTFMTTYIQPLIIDECAKSGLFNSLDVENFIHISRKINFYNVQVNYFLSILANTNDQFSPQLLTNCNKNMETSRIQILNDIKFIQEKLNLTLSNSEFLK